MLLEMHLDHITRMLNYLRYGRAISPIPFPHDSFGQVCDCSAEPVLPKDTKSYTRRRPVCLDHAERAMNGPQNEEQNKEVMYGPKNLEIRSAEAFQRGHSNDIQQEEHKMARQTGSCSKVREEESFNPFAAVYSVHEEATTISTTVYIGEEYQGPGRKLVERDDAVEVNDIIEKPSTYYRDQITTNGEDKDDEIDVEDRPGGTCYRERDAEFESCSDEVVLGIVVEEAMSKGCEMDECEDCQQDLRFGSAHTAVEHSLPE